MIARMPRESNTRRALFAEVDDTCRACGPATGKAMLRERVKAIVAAAAIAATTIFTTATAQPYPNRLITFISPGPPGGNTDLVTRPLIDRLTSKWGQPAIIDHRPGGGGGSIGLRAVIKARADGHTLLVCSPHPLVAAPALFKDLGYDPLRDLAPVATLFSAPQMLAVIPGVAANSVKELVAYAKANPGTLNFASPGHGAQPHLLGELFKRSTGVNIVHVSYKGSSRAVIDFLGGHVQMYFETTTLLLPHIRAGKVKVLAVADETRHAHLPAVPTTVEAGFPDIQATFWAGVLAPAGTPAAIVTTLNSAINDIMASAAMQENLDKISARGKPVSPQEFAAFLAAQSRKWTDLIRAADIRAE